MDLRKTSNSYGQWDAVELSAANQKMVYIPKGFAHGFCTLADETVVQYKVDSPYTPEYEGGLKWNDPTLDISWPAMEPVLSRKDESLPSFVEFISPF